MSSCGTPKIAGMLLYLVLYKYLWSHLTFLRCVKQTDREVSIILIEFVARLIVNSWAMLID